MYFNMDEWSQEIINAKDRRVLPVLFFPCLPLTGMSVVETVNDAKKQAQVMKATIDKYPEMIAAMTSMDLTVDTEAFGAQVIFKESEAPSVKEPVLKTAEDIKNLVIPDVHSGRVDIFLDAITEAQKLITDRPIFGGQLGPFSLAANLVDVQKALMMTMKEKDVLLGLLDKCTDFLIARALEYKKRGANGVFVAEPTAGMLSPKMMEKFSSVFMKRLVDAVQDSSFYVVLHNCGYVTKSVKSMYNTGAKGLHFGNGVNMVDVMEQLPPDVLSFGNVDPSTIFFQGTKEKAYEVTMELLESMEPYPHFVLSTGCDLPPVVPMETVDGFFEAFNDYNKKTVDQ